MTRALYSCRNAGLATLVWLLAMAHAPVAAQAKVYFTAFLAEGGTGIERAGFDGSGLATLQFEPTGFEDGLALDTLAGKMYWTDTNASVIASAKLNGTDAQIVLDDFGQEPLGIALDTANGKMYWTDREGVKRANLDGTERELLTKGPARGFIALDLAAARMYWADWPSGDIKAAAMTLEPTVTDVVIKQSAPFGIAVDHEGGKVYWLQLNLSKKKSEKEVIRRANIDGSEVQTLLERPGAGFEGGLAIDPAAGKLYWGEAEAHGIGVSNLDGSQAQTLFATGEDSPEGLAVETANPHPTNTGAPAIEGSAAVGNPLRCDPGTWTGTGPLSFAFQWGIVGGTAIEGAIGSTYVPSSGQAGEMLACLVTAADNVETLTATSAAVSVAGYPSEPVIPGQIPLIAGIASARLTSSGTSARVPVFTSLACGAMLEAKPMRRPRKRPTPHKGGKGARPPRAAASARSGSPRRATPKTVTVSQRLTAGRGLITLRRLLPGTTYQLVLMIKSADGQAVRDTATLRMARRRPVAQPRRRT